MTATKLPTERDIPAARETQRRARLLAAIETVPAAARSRPRWRLQLGAAGATGVAAAALGLLLTGGGAAAPPAAEASILHHVARALKAQSGTVLRESALVTPAGERARRFELWAQIGGSGAYRVIKDGHEGSFDGSHFSNYIAATNTITTSPVEAQQAGRSHAPADYAAALRALVASGQAKVAGTATVDGVAAYRLIVGGEYGGLVPGSSAYVAQGSYRPLEIDYDYHGGETVTFTAYEYLPATSANLSLLSVTAQHPAARVVPVE
jgi:hypothetical protein